MTRAEQIVAAARELSNWRDEYQEEFIKGAEWADQNPKHCSLCEQLAVQLASCGVVALGWGEPLEAGAHGWSASYEYVMRLRAKLQVSEQREKILAEALTKARHKMSSKGGFTSRGCARNCMGCISEKALAKWEAVNK